MLDDLDEFRSQKRDIKYYDFAKIATNQILGKKHSTPKIEIVSVKLPDREI